MNAPLPRLGPNVIVIAERNTLYECVLCHLRVPTLAHLDRHQRHCKARAWCTRCGQGIAPYTHLCSQCKAKIER